MGSGMIPPPLRVRDEGAVLPVRREMNFTGAGVTATDNPGAGRTDIAIASGSTNNITFEADSGLPVFNVRAAPYSAAGDGTTDDTAAIQDAIDDACNAAPYATVFLPFGYYKITAPLTINRPIRLLGEGCVVGDRLKNNNYAARGAVIWNASTSQDAIQFTPSVVAGTWPRGLGGMIFQDFGIDTPEIGGSTVPTWNSTGWGPFSTGAGIKLGTNAYYVQFRNVTVCRHYTGFKLNDGLNAYNIGSCDLSWCNALVCPSVGFDLMAVESRLSFCRAKNNDPEWGPVQDVRTAAAFASANPVLASGVIGVESDTSTLLTVKFKVGNGSTAYNSLPYGTIGDGGFPTPGGGCGFRYGADGNFFDNCIAITCDYGFAAYDPAYGWGFGGGHTLISNCGVDSSRRPFRPGTGGVQNISNCWGVACYFVPAGSACYPLDSNCIGYIVGSSFDATSNLHISKAYQPAQITGGSHVGGSLGGGTVATSVTGGKVRGVLGVSDYG